MRAAVLTMLTAGAACLPHAAGAEPYREVEVCFVLDTTGSMGNLIQAAKDKIWFIANEIVQAPSKPSVKLCLLAYRDREDAYVTRHTDLTADMDLVYRELFAYQADGGGDTPEAVNQGLREAIEKTRWSPGDDVLKLIFLVGDAPPKVYADEPQYPLLVAQAAQRGIVINPVLCGEDAETRTAWDAIARGTRGRFAAIAMNAAVQRVVTPIDQDLAALNKRLGHTLVPYGSDADREGLLDKQRAAERMDDGGVSDRLAFNVTTGSSVGGGDLIDAIERGEIDVATLDRARLPEAMRSMTEPELIAHLATVREERAGLRKVIRGLVEQRRSFIDARRAADARGFDAVVAETIRHQVAGSDAP